MKYFELKYLTEILIFFSFFKDSKNSQLHPTLQLQYNYLSDIFELYSLDTLNMFMYH